MKHISLKFYISWGCIKSVLIFSTISLFLVDYCLCITEILDSDWSVTFYSKIYSYYNHYNFITWLLTGVTKGTCFPELSPEMSLLITFSGCRLYCIKDGRHAHIHVHRRQLKPKCLKIELLWLHFSKRVLEWNRQIIIDIFGKNTLIKYTISYYYNNYTLFSLTF